jgi:hypothetical protein
MEDLRTISFRKGKQSHELDRSAEDGCSIEHPVPCCMLDNKCTDYRTHCRANEWEDVVEA